MNLYTLRRALYCGARACSDASAARRGPDALARREVRKCVYHTVNRSLYKVLRKGGLG